MIKILWHFPKAVPHMSLVRYETELHYRVLKCLSVRPPERQKDAKVQNLNLLRVKHLVKGYGQVTNEKEQKTISKDASILSRFKEMLNIFSHRFLLCISIK